MNLRIGIALVALAVVAALAGPWIVSADPRAQELALRLAGPTLAHPLGLDELGRDILARLVAGARISLLVGISVVSVSATLGLIVGGIAGYAGGWVDTLIGRVIDVLMAFPGILLAIALVAVLGPSLRNVVHRAGDHRLGGLRAARARPGAQGAGVRVRAGGAQARRLGAARPGAPRAAVRATRRCSCRPRSAWPARSSPRRRSASWGSACSRRRRAGGRCWTPGAAICSTRRTSPSFPGLAIALLVLGFNFLGDGLRDRIDPRSR